MKKYVTKSKTRKLKKNYVHLTIARMFVKKKLTKNTKKKRNETMPHINRQFDYLFKTHFHIPFNFQKSKYLDVIDIRKSYYNTFGIVAFKFN